MKCIIFANGYYGELERYRDIAEGADMIICADGGANFACQLGIVPSMVIGDMDSITAEARQYLDKHEVQYKKYPVRKDFTDLQLTLEIAEQAGADSFILLGTLGNRLDHTLANLFSCMELALRGKTVIHYGSDCTIHMVTRELQLKGCKGDLVSVIALTDKAVGVTETGMEYPLCNALLESSKPYAVSNVMAEDEAGISLQQGILAVFHYR